MVRRLRALTVVAFAFCGACIMPEEDESLPGGTPQCSGNVTDTQCTWSCRTSAGPFASRCTRGPGGLTCSCIEGKNTGTSFQASGDCTGQDYKRETEAACR